MYHDIDIAQWILVSALLALFAPLLSGMIAAAISPRYAWLISLTAPFMLLLSLVAACILFYEARGSDPMGFSVPWFMLNDQTIEVGLYIDKLTVVMVLLVCLISFLVHLYSTGYMAGDQSINRYFFMLGFFTFAMLGIVLADNLLLIFVFWELVGFSSYMLIGHWTELPEAAKACTKAFIMNRLGDLGFIVGLMIVYHQTGSFQLVTLYNEQVLPWETAASLCFFLGIIGKSAQFPLLTWLPDAMAGPSPVSALIHAATMVAAGVFLLARIHFLFTPVSLNAVVMIGLLTSLMGATAALTHYDIKKILAYSTVSQLGFMMVGMGVGAHEGAILHLFTHAFFKAGLFLAAGSIIHSLHQAQQGTGLHFDVQDIRNLGGLRHALPLTFVVFLICGASLAGLPFFSGFQSKESVLTAMISWDGFSWSWKGLVTAFVGVTIFLTVCYTFRLIWFAFIATPGLRDITNLSIPEIPFVMRLPMIILASCSMWWIVSINPLGFSGWFHTGHGSGLITILSLLTVASALAYSYYHFRRQGLPARQANVNIFSETFYLDRVYGSIVLRTLSLTASFLSKIDRKYIDGLLHGIAYAQVTLAHFIGWFDRIFIDGAVNGIARLAGGAGVVTRSFQGGKIQFYIFWAGLGLLLLMLFLIT